MENNINITEITEKYFNHYNSKNIIINNNNSFDNVAVIVEPRKHKYLIPVIKNVMINLGPTWNLHIFGSDNNEQYLKEYLLGSYKFTNLNINDLNQTSYSLLLMSLFFWNNIAEENIIIFQVDSFINNSYYNIPKQYGFIGAVFNFGVTTENNVFIDTVSPVGYVYNISGGFSFRRKSVMINCIKNVTINDIINFRTKNNYDVCNFKEKYILMEDSFFANAMSLLNYTLPSPEICNSFCSQQNIYHNSFAIHGFDKPYCGFKQKDLEYFFAIKS